MDTFITIMGWAVTVLICLIAFVVLAGIALSAFDRVIDKLKERGAAEVRRELHRDLLAGSYWFSEHPPTSALLREYAQRVVDMGERNTDAIRSQWRTWMADHRK